MRYALILAAGTGQRMRPLSTHPPKPLLMAAGKPLIVWHLERLAAARIHHVVINTSYLAEQFPETLGDGARWGLEIHYAHEGPQPLETGGGMLAALPLLGAEPFLVISGDTWCDANLSTLPASPARLAHLLMVENPPHHGAGDFSLDTQGLLHRAGKPRLTFSGIGVFRHTFVKHWRDFIDQDAIMPGSLPTFALRQLLLPAMDHAQITGERHVGTWTDVGTPKRLNELNQHLIATLT